MEDKKHAIQLMTQYMSDQNAKYPTDIDLTKEERIKTILSTPPNLKRKADTSQETAKSVKTSSNSLVTFPAVNYRPPSFTRS